MINSQRYIINGNLAYESVARKRIDNSTTRNISERKLLWDGENRLRALSENGYVSLYWYDTDGNRTVKEPGGPAHRHHHLLHLPKPVYQRNGRQMDEALLRRIGADSVAHGNALGRFRQPEHRRQQLSR